MIAEGTVSVPFPVFKVRQAVLALLVRSNLSPAMNTGESSFLVSHSYSKRFFN